MAKRGIIFTASPFAKSDIQLGSLITSRSRPDINAFSPIIPSASDISRKEDDAFKNSWHTQSSAAFTATLSKLFSASFTQEPSAQIKIAAAPGSDGLKSFIYTLKNQQELFMGLCKMEEVHDWLEEGYSISKEAWLVVEYRTLVNACVTLSERKSGGASGKAAVPIAELAGGVAPGGVADAAMEGKYERVSENMVSFVAKEERVFAVGCRKVRLSWWSKKDLKFDKETCWKCALSRGNTEGQAEGTTMMADFDDETNDEEDSNIEQRVSLGDEIFLKLASG